METTIPRLLNRIASKYPDHEAQMQKDSQGVFQAVSFSMLQEKVKKFALVLRSLGVGRGDFVGMISDNRQEWLVSDLALHCLGAADVPRGCDSHADEIAYILAFSQCSLSIVENQLQLEKILEKKAALPKLEKIIVLDPGFDPALAPSHQSSFQILAYAALMESIDSSDFQEIEAEIEKGKGEDVATVIYTSGTTGTPKGVMLTHRNFLYQLENIPDYLDIETGNGGRWLSVLPVWHSFERIMQYVALHTASTLCYSKPVGAILLADMALLKPKWMASVPRIWESVYGSIYRKVNQGSKVKKALFHFFVAVASLWVLNANLVRGRIPRFRRRIRALDFLIGILPFLVLLPFKALGNVLVFKTIKAKLGGRFVAGISGGGGLPSHVDQFFQAVGVLLLEGYGLTESAPVISLRKQQSPIPGTIGTPFSGTEIKVVGKDGSILPPNQIGVLHARGPQIMKGYYRQEELTAEVIDSEGFLNTGDLVKTTHDGEIKVVGREKDTIVLLGGENIEPAPIEEKLKMSPYIASAMMVGQDKKFLCALILPALDNVKEWAESQGISFTDETTLLSSNEVHKLISEEILALISQKNGFKIFELITRFHVLTQAFTVGKELSAKQEIKRFKVNDLYAKEIAQLFS